MTTRPITPEGTPVGGWILKSADAASVIADLKEFGQVFRFPIPDSPRVDLIEAGQPCFLYVGEPGNAKVKPGIWAVGEVVGPVTVGLPEDNEGSATDGAEVDDHDERLFAEVELIPLQTRITLGELNDHRVLVGSELIDRPAQVNPVVLHPKEVRALEEWDFALVEPTEEQMARLDEVLDDDDAGLIFQLFGEEGGIGIVDDGADGLLAVVAVDAEDEATELGRYDQFADALEAVAHHGGSFTFPAPSPAGEPSDEPIAVLHTADGPLRLQHTDDGIELWDGADEAELLIVFEDLPSALEGLAGVVEEVGDD